MHLFAVCVCAANCGVAIYYWFHRTSNANWMMGPSPARSTLIPRKGAHRNDVFIHPLVSKSFQPSLIIYYCWHKQIRENEVEKRFSSFLLLRLGKFWTFQEFSWISHINRLVSARKQLMLDLNLLCTHNQFYLLRLWAKVLYELYFILFAILPRPNACWICSYFGRNCNFYDNTDCGESKPQNESNIRRINKL